MASWKEEITLVRTPGLRIALNVKVGSPNPTIGDMVVEDGGSSTATREFLEGMLGRYKDVGRKLNLANYPTVELPASLTEDPLSLVPILMTQPNEWSEGLSTVIEDLLIPLKVRSEVRPDSWPIEAGTRLKFFIDGGPAFCDDHIRSMSAYIQR